VYAPTPVKVRRPGQDGCGRGAESRTTNFWWKTSGFKVDDDIDPGTQQRGVDGAVGFVSQRGPRIDQGFIFGEVAALHD